MFKDSVTRLSEYAALLTGRRESESHSLRRYTRIARGLVSALAGKGMSVVVSILSVPMTVGYLGAERYGIWMTISTMLAWLGLTDGGVGNSLTNVLSGVYAEDRRDLARIHISSVLCMLGILAAGLAALYAGVAHFIDWNSLLGAHGAVARQEVNATVAITLLVFLANIPLSTIGRTLCAYQESATANFWSAAGNVAGLTGLYLTTRAHLGMPWIIAGVSVPPLCVTALSGIWLFYFHKPWLRPTLKSVRIWSIRQLAHVGGMFFVIQIAALVTLQTDNIIIAHYLGAGAVTPYSVTWRLFNFAVLVPTLLMQSFWPAYSEALARRDGPWIRRAFRSNLFCGIGATLVVALPFVIFGRTIILHWTRAADAVPSMLLLVLMGVWSVINGAFSVMVTLLNGIGHIRIQMIAGLATSAVNLILSIWLVKRLGVEGVIAGTVLAYLIVGVAPFMFEIRRVLKLLPGS